MKVTVLPGQSLLDISLQVYGSAEGVFILAQENNRDVTDELKDGMELTYSYENIIDKQIVDYYRTNNIHPASAFSTDRTFEETFDLTFK